MKEIPFKINVSCVIVVSVEIKSNAFSSGGFSNFIYAAAKSS